MAVLSLGIDLGLGQPMEHMLRQCVISLELAKRSDLSGSDAELVYLVGLLAFVGCHGDSHEQARWFGDDIALRADVYTADLTPMRQARFMMSRVGAGAPPARRARTVVGFMRTGRRELGGMRVGHCSVAGELAVRLGLGEEVRDALQQVFERWDGNGDPGAVGGPEIGMPARLVQFADVVEVFHRTGGVDAALGVARARRGTQFDPGVVDLFCEHHSDVLAPLDDPESWDPLLFTHPRLGRSLADEDVTAAFEAIADFTDLKSPYTLGHSRAVADLAADAATVLGLPAEQVTAIRAAGLLHDLGRLGISNGIWDKVSPLTASERERIRLAPYLTDRMLSASTSLASLAGIASAHQERLDGSGYPRRLKGDSLAPAARVLAAADVYQAMLEPRPHRPARPAGEAADELRAEARAGRLDGEAVASVLRAAGHPTRKRPERPAGLTPREVEVLALIARGLQSKEIAQRLVITLKTVDHHIGHIYMKIGASNRVTAALFATEHGLLGASGER